MVAVSVEGKTISRFGEVSLIVVGTRLKVYLFDAYIMEKKCFDEGLKDLLENQNILKVSLIYFLLCLRKRHHSVSEVSS